MRLGNVGKVGVGWTIFVILGVSGFAVSRSVIEKQRYDSMKVRERMRKSNEGEYEVPASRRYEV